MRRTLQLILAAGALLVSGCSRQEPQRIRISENTYAGIIRQDHSELTVDVREDRALFFLPENKREIEIWVNYKVTDKKNNRVICGTDENSDGTFESITPFPIDKMQNYIEPTIWEGVEAMQSARTIKKSENFKSTSFFELKGKEKLSMYHNYVKGTSYLNEERR